jgi:WD40 repeat protein
VVNAVSISADNKLVAAAGTDGIVTLWERAGKEADPLILPQGEKAFNVAVSPDGSVVAVAGRLGKAYLYNINQRGEPRTLQCYDGPPRPEVRVESIGLSSDGALAATGCEKTLQIWDTASGRLVRDVRGASSRINSLAFAPDGKALATVDNEGSLTLWDASTGAILKSVPAHADESFSVAYSRDGTRIATAGRKDYTVKIWDADTLALKQTLVRATQH